MASSEQTPQASIVVTNWNGKAFIEECVATLWASGVHWGRPFELIVVDDVSSDGSPELVAEKFPAVRLLRNERNLGFAGTSNHGAEAARAPIIVMMNNDMRVPKEFLGNLVAPFFEPRREGETLFCVGAKSIDWHDGKPNHLCMRAAWRRGAIGHEWADPPHRCETTYAQGGSAAYDRALYLQLGGFDRIFHPTYWDDYDLSYRAGKLGWTTLYEPTAVVDHLGKATLRRQVDQDRLEQILERNRLWFNWLNLTDGALIARHVAALPWVYGRDLAQGRGTNGVKGFWRALKGIVPVLAERRRRLATDPPRRHTDRELVRTPAQG
ncbi:MAG: glycosyltransferase family 2 protein [Candidatus Sumerlaeia bacterium]|nr:glycosyltransferase family 2 protein [Candidatus Sumerlaeia bacterium]